MTVPQIDALPPVTEEMLRGLTQAQIRSAQEIARELGRDGAKQHSEQVEWAHSVVKKISEPNIPELKNESGNDFAVTVEPQDVEGDLITHVIGLTEAQVDSISGEVLVLDRTHEMAVSTELQVKQHNEQLVIAYVTKTRALVPMCDGEEDVDDDDDPEMMLTEVHADRVVGAVVE